MNILGLVIVVKNVYVYYILFIVMSENKVEKKYIIVVDGIIKENEGIIDELIYRFIEDLIKRIIDERG